MYDVGEQLLAEVKAFYREASACVKVDGGFSLIFFIDRCVRKMKA